MRILVLMHEYQQSKRGKYVIGALRQEWEKKGIQVTIVFGTKERPEADLLIPHIDLTHRPPEYEDFINSYPNVINRNVIDLSKRRISKNLLSGDEDYSGPVIVKTDNNCCGRPDANAYRRKHPYRSWIRKRAASIGETVLRKPMRWRKILPKYPIYDCMKEVPAGVWKNQALVVEKFLPEKEGDYYHLRLYMFLGDCSRSVREASLEPFVKSRTYIGNTEIIPVPDELLQFRRELGLDYGKIDYIIHKGQVEILDVSQTLGIGSKKIETPESVIDFSDLAEGIWSFLPSK